MMMPFGAAQGAKTAEYRFSFNVMNRIIRFDRIRRLSLGYGINTLMRSQFIVVVCI